MMQKLLIPHGFTLSKVTTYKYMEELGLKSIVRRKKPGYRKGPAHKVFPDLLNQNFRAERPNQVWCVDFTYLYLKGGKIRYNCTIIDLYDRSVIVSVNGDHITTELAIRALFIAIKRHKPARGLIFHSDQGSQFTSKEFVSFCEAHFIQQSMSRAGCPYDNAPMERYFNTLKCELIYLFQFEKANELDTAVAEFAYGWYNRIRPHTYNGGLTPAAARVA
jgi:transposase InsO family protein